MRVVDVDGGLLALRRRDRLLSGEPLLGEEVALTVASQDVGRGVDVEVDSAGYVDTPDGRVLVGAVYHGRPGRVRMLNDEGVRVLFDPEASGLVLAQLVTSRGVDIRAASSDGRDDPATWPELDRFVDVGEIGIGDVEVLPTGPDGLFYVDDDTSRLPDWVRRREG